MSQNATALKQDSEVGVMMMAVTATALPTATTTTTTAEKRAPVPAVSLLVDPEAAYEVEQQQFESALDEGSGEDGSNSRRRDRLADSPEKPGDFAHELDGRAGWMQVLVAHLELFNTFGYINSYGIFEAYYAEHFGLPLSTLAWAGSVQPFLLLFIGTFSGRLYDAGYLRALLVVAAAFQLLGVFAASAAGQYWQLFLAQGVCSGVGAGIAYTPVIANVSSYFDARRSLAIAVTTCGSVLGGIVYPLIAQQLLPRVGFPWMMRCMGFVMLFNSAFVVAFARPPRVPPRRRGPWAEMAAFREPPFVFFVVGTFLNLWAVYVAYDYVNHYASSVLQANAGTSLTMLLILNGAGLPGRIAPALVSDAWLGPVNTLIPLAAASGVLYFAWAAVRSLAGLFAFAALFGFVNGGVQGMGMAGLPSLTSDRAKLGVRSGMVLSLASAAALTGGPVAGALIQAAGGRYLYMQLWGGCTMVAGACFMTAARVASSRAAAAAAAARSASAG